jgi:hypothetical protein
MKIQGLIEWWRYFCLFVTEKKSSAHRQSVHKEENPGFIPPSNVVNPQSDLDKAWRIIVLTSRL